MFFNLLLLVCYVIEETKGYRLVVKPRQSDEVNRCYGLFSISQGLEPKESFGFDSAEAEIMCRYDDFSHGCELLSVWGRSQEESSFIFCCIA